MSFQVTFTNVLITLLYIVPGFLMCKAKKASANHLSTMSAILVYICSPCMVINSFLGLEFSVQQLKDMGVFFLITLFLQGSFMMVLFLALKKKYEDSRYRILTIGSVLGNVGFFGLPLIKALLPQHPEAMCYSCIFLISMNLLVFTMGVYCLTKNTKYLSLKSAILNPSMFGMAVALPMYIFGGGQYVPEVLKNALNILSAMTTPICMMILGVRLASVSFRKLFSRPFVYITCLGKLVIFPLFCFALVSLLPVSDTIRASVLILASTPCASIILNMAEMHRSETELSANCVLLSTLLCLFTIPVLMLLVG